ncbi:MAG: AAA family ATPase [Tepidisphaeraceae bacterium]|jgi:pilus assembly protein CpaE
MVVQLNCVIVDADNGNREELAGFLSHFGVLPVAQLGTVDHLAGLLSRPEAPMLAIVNLDPNPQETLRKISQLPRQFPLCSFFLMSQTVDAGLLMEAMHLGIREFIPLPISEQKFSAAIERVAQSHGMGKRARIIHVIPTIGGCGSTTVACNIAAALARSGKTVLIDLDLVRGGVASYFDTRARYTIADIMDAAEKLDKQLLDNALAIHKKSNLAILARPELPEDTQRVNQAGLTRLLNVLSRVFDYVVIDSVMSISPMYASVIQSSDVNLLVMQLNVPSAKNAERFVGALRRMGVESSKIMTVVNRYVKKGNDIEPDELERSLGLKVSWLIPNDFRNAIQAINFGEPVVLRSPKSEIAVSLVELASTLEKEPGATAPQQGQGQVAA